MRQTKSLVLLAGAALTMGGVYAGEQPAGNDEVRAVVAEMLADAETRSSLLSGADAGHDGKFFIAGEGFRLNVGGQLQFRYLANFRDDDNIDDFDTGFQTRRSKLNFDGTINENWAFKLLFAFDRDGGDATLEEAWAGYRFANGAKVRWGQFKLPLLREELVSSTRQLAVERSATNEAFTQDRSQGIELSYETEDWRAFGAFSDGLDSENTDFLGQPGNSNFRVQGEGDFAFTGRFEYKFAGEWKQFEDFTSRQGDAFAALLGLAAHYQQSANTNNISDLDRSVFQYTADVSLEGDSWNAYGAFIGRYDDQRQFGNNQDFNDFGMVLQGGFRFAPDTELFARWDALWVDEDRGTDEDNFHFLTVGLNQYYAGHAAKATVDLVYCFSETADLVGLGLFPDTGTGILGDTEEGEIVLRLQFQLLF